MQKIEQYQIDEDCDLILLEKQIIALHHKVAHLNQRIIVIVALEEKEDEFPQYSSQGK